MIREDWSTLRKLTFMSMIAGGKLVEDTATGNPLTFITDVSKPLKSLLIPFTPQQEGTGDPSPQNIRSILPWNGLSVWLSRETATFVQGGISDGSGINTTTNTRIRTDYIPVSVLTVASNTLEMYGIGYSEDEPVIRMIHFYNGSKQWLSAISQDLIYRKSYLILDSQIPENAEYFRVSAQKNRVGTEDILPDGIALFINKQSVTDIVFPSPVYGGTLDVVSGVLTVEWVTKQFDGSSDENWYFVQVGSSSWYRAYIIMSDAKQPNDISAFADSYKAVSFNNRSYSSKVCMFGNENESPIIFNVITELTTLEDFKAYLAENPLTIAYKLATPTEQTLTGEQITAIVGDNTIWSDADGSMTAVYLKKG